MARRKVNPDSGYSKPPPDPEMLARIKGEVAIRLREVNEKAASMNTRLGNLHSEKARLEKAHKGLS